MAAIVHPPDRLVRLVVDQSNTLPASRPTAARPIALAFAASLSLGLASFASAQSMDIAGQWSLNIGRNGYYAATLHRCQTAAASAPPAHFTPSRLRKESKTAVHVPIPSAIVFALASRRYGRRSRTSRPREKSMWTRYDHRKH